MYKILDRVINNANKLNVSVKPSKNKKYKLEVYDNNGLFLFHVGANGYGDYSTYLKENGMSYANERQRLYKIRHAKDLKVKGSKGYYANKLLWE
jgi:hypothetical protein